LEISRRLGCSRSAVSNAVQKHKLDVQNGGYHHKKYSLSSVKLALATSQPNQFNHRFINPPETKIYDDFWELPWDEWIMACDTHSPYVDTKIFNKMIQVAQHYGIKNFIHGGDFWDQSQFSFFDIDPEDLTDFSYDVRYSKSILKALDITFKDVRFFLGSHDVRYYKMLMSKGKHQKVKDIWNLLDNDKIQVSQYRFANIGPPGTGWRFNHPKNTVKAGGLSAVRMEAKFNRSMAFAHGHWFGHIMAPDGIHHLVAPGCMADKRRVSYKNAWDTSHDEWVNAFCMVVEKNKPILFSEHTPWGLYLK